MQIHTDLDTLNGIQDAVLTVGSFDGVHIGHQRIIEQLCSLAKQKQGRQTVLLSFHPHPRGIVGKEAPALLSTIEEKQELLQKAGLDHLVITPFTKAFSQQSPEEYIRDIIYARFHPAVVVIGYDHRYGKGRVGDFQLMQDFGAKLGFEVLEISAQSIEDIAVSSTKIRLALKEGKLEKAKRYLGYNYSLRGKVVQGQQIGRSIGFPTANIVVEEQEKLIPQMGVYACLVHKGSDSYKAMLYIGNRPTLKQSELSIEAHLFDFSGDLYGQTLRVEFIQQLRGERTFADLQALRQALQEDKELALRVL